MHDLSNSALLDGQLPGDLKLTGLPLVQAVIQICNVIC